MTYKRSRDGHVVNITIKHPGKCAYKHVPYSENASHIVAYRNARERRRVQADNNTFLWLRKHVAFENKHRRLSNGNTLKAAIDQRILKAIK